MIWLVTILLLALPCFAQAQVQSSSLGWPLIPEARIVINPTSNGGGLNNREYITFNFDRNSTSADSTTVTMTASNLSASASSATFSNSRISGTGTQLPGGAFIFSAWIKTSTAATASICFRGTQVGGTESLSVAVLNTGLLRVGLWSSGGTPVGVSSSSTVNGDTWTHVAATWTGSGDGNMVVYVNGIQENTGIQASVLRNTDTTLYFGSRDPADPLFFPGKIDEIVYWVNPVNTPNNYEVRQLYERGRTKYR